MTLEEWIAKKSRDAIRTEINSIAEALGAGSNETLKRNAMTTAKSFLKTNKLADPITLARASFYVALKKTGENAEEKVKLIIDNNGNTNRWWLYIIPMLEKHFPIG